ncbi:MAG: hypothetical protein BHW25_07560 [Faecalibacterium sp. CAG:82-related_59_9]|nr:MAG: hypothetical protein BHW25_07560 [Faecalibacterium sp. CAG:82-related_59_9]
MRKNHRGQRPESDEPLSAGRVEYLEQARARVRARRLRRTALIVAVLTAVVLFTTGLVGSSVALVKDCVDTTRIALVPGPGWPQQTGVMEPTQVLPMTGGFVELGGDSCMVYSRTGTRLNSIQSGYGRPALAAGKTRFVLYNRSGNELRVESRTQNLYTKKLENKIFLCAMSDNGTLAVVTESGRYAAQLQIFDPSFRQTYSWEMTQNEGTPIAVAFSPDNRQFAAGTLAARQGQLGCKVYFMSTSSNSEGPAYTASQGSMLLSLDWQSESRVVAVFDTYIAVLDPRTATEIARYDFGGATLQSAAPGQRQTALLLNIRGGNSLVTLDNDLTPLAEIPARQAYGIKATDTAVYLLCPNAVECYGFDGVQNWVQDNFSARPIQVLKASELLVFTGSRAEVLTPPDNDNNTNDS